MRILQRIRCLFGTHHRGRRSVWKSGEVKRGRCDGCGKAMIKDRDVWRLARPGE